MPADFGGALLRVRLAVEPSPAFGVAVRILPGGQVDLDLTLAEVANKELREETGCRAGRWPGGSAGP